MVIDDLPTQEFWSGAWIAIPVALSAAAASRALPLRPASRHTLWLVALAWFFAPLAASRLPSPADLPGWIWPANREVRSVVAAPPTQAPPTSPAPTARLFIDAQPSRAVQHALSAPPPDPLATAPIGPPPGAPSHLGTDWSGYAPVAIPVAAAPAVLPPSNWRLQINAWMEWIERGGEAVGRFVASVPAPPAGAWLVGLCGAAVWMAISLLRVVGLSGERLAVPAWVEHEVEQVAREIGLRRAPRVRLTDRNISPLVACWIRPVLVLPVRLWWELDGLGRRAVLCHELAHLRRRDHWVRWLELAATALYWWHPVLWWVRRNLRDEADLSCDAWVAHLFPRQRRRYAEALLRIREFVGEPKGSASACAMMVVSPDARRLARRITMVMTHKSRPASGLSGLALAGMLLAIGLTSSSALSCQSAGGDRRDDGGNWREDPAAAREDRGVYRERRAESGSRRSRSAGVGTAPDGSGGSAGGGEPQEWRLYSIGGEKLEALWALMSRNDVPVYVSRADDGIAAQLTPEQHRVFSAFVEMIARDGPPPPLTVMNMTPFSAASPTPPAPPAPTGQLFGAPRRSAPATPRPPAAAAIPGAPMARTVPGQPADGRHGELMRQADALREQAEALRRQAEALRAELERMQEELRRSPDGRQDRSWFDGRRDEVARQAAELEAQAASIEAYAASLNADSERFVLDAVAPEVAAATVPVIAAYGALNADRSLKNDPEFRRMLRAEIERAVRDALAADGNVKAQIAAERDAARTETEISPRPSNPR